MSTEPGVIHDIGYQRYAGPRLGRRYATWSIYVHSVRTAIGLGRSAKAKVLPLGVFGIMCVAALILVAISTQLPEPVLSYVGMASTFSYAVVVFVAMVGPELISRDLRNTVLPLYFSRPPLRTDYALAKLGALATTAFAVFAAPMLIMFLGLAFNSSDGVGGVVDEAGGLGLGLLAAVIHAAVMATIAAPLAALTSRRVFATALIIGVFLLSAPVSGVLAAIGSGSVPRLAPLLNPVSLLSGIDDWLFGENLMASVDPYGPLYGVVAIVVVAAGTMLLVWRCKKVKA